MQTTRFKVAEHLFEVNMKEGDIMSFIPSLEPFRTDDDGAPLFSITVDNSIAPSWRGTRIGHFPCPSASFEVYRQDGYFKPEECTFGSTLSGSRGKNTLGIHVIKTPESYEEAVNVELALSMCGETMVIATLVLEPAVF